MSTNEQAHITHADASKALDDMDDYARMEMGVDAYGPRGVLERYIAQQAATLRQSADSGRVGDDERQWRELLAIRVAGPMLYTDDGELSDATAVPYIDFLRDSADTIARKLADRSRAALAAQGQGEPEEMSPEFTDTARGAIAWVLYHYQGGSSAIGQPLRFALGMGAHERMSDTLLADAKRWAKLAGASTEQFHPAPTASPAEVPGIQVSRQGIRFGANCWYSHEYITGFEAARLNNGECNIAAREYMKWLQEYLAAAPSAPEPAAQLVDKTKVGLYRKFNVTRTDGSSAPGGKHEDCEYFVLDMTHDPFALPALTAYASACAVKYPPLAADLRSRYGLPEPAAQGEAFDFAVHLQRQRQWSGNTFGPGSRAQGVVDHIRKELLEIEADPCDLKEWIDVVILALDGAWRSGAQPQEIIAALVAKQTKNEGRVWPDWRTADPNKAIEHDRSYDTADMQASR